MASVALWAERERRTENVFHILEREPSFDRFFFKFDIQIVDSTINVDAKYQSFLQHSFLKIK